MKVNFKRIMSVMLILVTISCVAFSIGTNASAAQLGEKSDSVAVEPEDPVKEDFSKDDEPDVTTPTQPETQPATNPNPPLVTVGKVLNLRKTAATSDAVTLEWDKTIGAKGYAVYYCNADKTSKYTRYAYVTANKCTVKNLAHTSQYFFKVAAYVESLGSKYEGIAASKKTATQPPVPTLRLKAANKNIQITWSKNTRATGYKIYKYNPNTKKYEKYKTIGNCNTVAFTDKNVTNGKVYYYKVRAYRTLSTGCTYHSAYSETAVVFSGLDSVDFSMTSQLSRVSFSWPKSKYASGYEIYYSTSENGKYTRLAATKKTFYNTKQLKVGQKYYFRIRPYRIVGAKKVKVIGTFLTKAKKVSDKGYGVDVGNTYIEISLKQQHMWYYVNGKVYCETDVVTGNDDGYHNTPKGTYKIYQKMSPATLTGADYSSYVQYWMPFKGGYGIHDASWRSSGEYGGTTYKGNGSHGCVNTPKSSVKKIYNKVKVGTYVVIY